MTTGGLFNVTRKEFTDHLTSRKFLIVLALFLVISTIGMYQGIKSYNDQLESYSQQLQNMPEITGPDAWMPQKPSIMQVFLSMASQIVTLGSILAIAMGFDLVSREKETRSLKTLLSHPVFRDEIINGKALGGILALVFAMGSAFVISLAALLLFSIVPSMNELGAIVVFGIVSVVFLLSFFAIALMMSTVSGESGNALIYTLVIFFLLSAILPTIGYTVGGIIAGDPPDPPGMMFGAQRAIQVTSVDDPDGTIVKSESIMKEPAPINNEEWQRFEEESRAYYEKQKVITDVFNLASPQMNYMVISMAITNPYYSTLMSSSSYYMSTMPAPMEENPGLIEILSSIWKNIVALVVFPAAFFAIAYVKFMRMDVR